MHCSPTVSLTEVVRLDRLEYLAAREAGRDYTKDNELWPLRNYARLALERGERIGKHVHYNVKYAHGRKTPGFGMLFGEGGLQAIDGELKRFLLEGSPAYDIDQ
eukprot:CAMPEP_0179838606 /NCGR_PEP_ID=MMETSP0982-20121206/794_1 /TAXON_ID=483367 /ORGANISM="non described non described, Strain CCMP 2436" /LENGTH=103 /DNA_ID=CAMNT_0021722045 /DNA_START=329 /DNA_END=637 /DNA_ORIENTATION=+